MAELDPSCFIGDRLLDTDIVRCEVQNKGEAVDALLTDAGWNGGPAACILLTLGQDNTTIVQGELVTRGMEEKEVEWPANTIWPAADKRVKTTVTMPAMDSFLFLDGGLTSDFINDEEVIHFNRLHRKDQTPETITDANRQARGIGRFCLRMLCSIKSSTHAEVKLRYTVYLYPDTRENMMAISECATRPEWPGMKLTEGELIMLPPPTAPWGCPVLPALLPAQPLEEIPRVPSSSAMREAIAAIMRRCGIPEGSRSGAKVREKWEKIARNPASLTSKLPPTVWPGPRMLAATSAGNEPPVSGTIQHIMHIFVTQVQDSLTIGFADADQSRTGSGTGHTQPGHRRSDNRYPDHKLTGLADADQSRPQTRSRNGSTTRNENTGTDRAEPDRKLIEFAGADRTKPNTGPTRNTLRNQPIRTGAVPTPTQPHNWQTGKQANGTGKRPQWPNGQD